jgi:hypothetical protein
VRYERSMPDEGQAVVLLNDIVVETVIRTLTKRSGRFRIQPQKRLNWTLIPDFSHLKRPAFPNAINDFTGM